jgi:hypothetical protein
VYVDAQAFQDLDGIEAWQAVEIAERAVHSWRRAGGANQLNYSGQITNHAGNHTGDLANYGVTITMKQCSQSNSIYYPTGVVASSNSTLPVCQNQQSIELYRWYCPTRPACDECMRTPANCQALCHTQINGFDYNKINWATRRTTDSTYVDMEQVVLHELGHTQGLGHSNDAPSNITDAVMYAFMGSGTTEEKLQAVRPDDVAGIRSLYGARATRLYVDYVSTANGTQTFRTDPAGQPTGTPAISWGTSNSQVYPRGTYSIAFNDAMGLKLVESTDEGYTWGSPALISQGTLAPPAIANVSGPRVIVYAKPVQSSWWSVDDQLVYATRCGNGFPDVADLPLPIAGPAAKTWLSPAVSVAPDGNLVVAWVDAATRQLRIATCLNLCRTSQTFSCTYPQIPPNNGGAWTVASNPAAGCLSYGNGCYIAWNTTDFRPYFVRVRAPYYSSSWGYFDSSLPSLVSSTYSYLGFMIARDAGDVVHISAAWEQDANSGQKLQLLRSNGNADPIGDGYLQAGASNRFGAGAAFNSHLSEVAYVHSPL